MMTTNLEQPNISKVLSEGRESVSNAKTQANDDIKTHNDNYGNKLRSINSEANRDRGLVQDTKNIGTATSQLAVDTEAKKVEVAEEVLRQAMEALENAQNSYAAASDTHSETVKTLQASFNQASKDIKQRSKNQTKEAKLANKEAKQAEKAKVSAARQDARQDVVHEVKAAADYRVYVVKDTAVSVGNGVAHVFNTLGKAFDDGYKVDSGVELPESLKARQTTTAKKTANMKNS